MAGEKPEDFVVHKSTRNPNSVLWIAGGAREYDSVVSLFRVMAKEIWPEEVRHRLYTNSMNVAGFPGRTYVTKKKSAGSLAEKMQDIVMTAHLEGELIDSDIIVTSSWYASQIVRHFCIERLRLRERPTVTVQVYAENCSLIDPTHEGPYWISIANEEQYCIVMDNDNQIRSYKRRARKYHPSGTTACISRMRNYEFEDVIGTDWVTDRTGVMWTGRWNATKNPMMAAEMTVLLNAEGQSVDFFVPSEAAMMVSSEMDATLDKIDGKLCLEYPQKRFWEDGGSQAVMIVTSEDEAFALAQVEMAERGVIPVMYKRKWNRTLFGPDWPLEFSTAGEGVAMVQAALENQSFYRSLIRDRREQRYSKPTNLQEVFEKIWRHYISRSHEEDVVPNQWLAGRVK